jgi:hypothetical protein
MGIKYAHAYSYVIKDLDIDHIYHIACNRMQQHNINDRTPTIDIDASWVARGKGSNAGRSRVEYLVSFALTFAKVGFSVMLVFDGNMRHHSKRATIQQQSEQQRNRIEIIIKKSELMSIAEERRKTDSIELRNKLNEQEAAIQKKYQD